MFTAGISKIGDSCARGRCFSKVIMRPSTPNVVVFDLGGVLARICYTWEEAAESAAVPHGLAPNGRTALVDLPAFDAYQAGIISFEKYLRQLALFIGCSEEDALHVHNGIIVEEFPTVAQLVREVEATGARTGCLSNTNAAHWVHLAQNGQYPTIQRLQMKMASHLVGLNKPDPAIYQTYCRTFELQPEQIAFFDDHPLNVQEAVNQGWHASLINPLEDTAVQMRAHLARIGVLPDAAIA
jgi:glucose-1-phosphatase